MHRRRTDRFWEILDAYRIGAVAPRTFKFSLLFFLIPPIADSLYADLLLHLSLLTEPLHL